MIRGFKGKGQKPNWFKTLEDKVIEQSTTRKIKEEYQITAPNRSVIICKKVKISQDRKKRSGSSSRKKEDRKLKK